MLILDRALSPLERIKLTGQLSAKASSLNGETSPIARIRLAREVADLIATLGGAVAAPAAPKIAFSLSDKMSSADSLSGYLAGPLNDLPEPIRAFEADTVRDLAMELKDYTLAGHADTLMSKAEHQTHKDETKIAVFDLLAARGVNVEIDHEKVAAEHDALKEQIKQGAMSHAPYKEAFDAINAHVDGVNKVLSELRRKIHEAHMGGNTDEVKRLSDEENRILDEYSERRKELMSVRRAAEQEFNELRAKREREGFEQAGRAVIDSILKSSPISAEQAREWASKQIVDENAKVRLKKMGYSIEKVYEDMAEFYRISGGKSSAVRIATAGGGRASAAGIDTRVGEKVVYLGSQFNKTVLFHELAHHLENDPIAKAASNGFLLKRRESPKRYSLRSLTGITGYKSSESAYRDKWLNEYIGKVYADGVTEVFSMGVQYLAKPMDAAVFAAKDPEMFAMITGYLTSPLTPAMEAKLNMHETAISSLVERKKSVEERYEAAIAKLASQITLTDDQWFVPGNNTQHDFWIKYLSSDKRLMPKFVGSFNDYRVFDGVFKNWSTKRRAKGHLVMRMFSVDDLGGMMNVMPVHGGIEMVKAMIGASEASGITRLRSLYVAYYDRKDKIVELAGVESGATP